MYLPKQQVVLLRKHQVSSVHQTFPCSIWQSEIPLASSNFLKYLTVSGNLKRNILFSEDPTYGIHIIYNMQNIKSIKKYI